VRRRKFITLLGGAAASWPLAASAQQAERMRRVGVLMNATKDDPHVWNRFSAFVNGLQQLGWTEGRNLKIDVRWGTLGATVDKYLKDAAELGLTSDVILVSTTPTLEALQRATRTVPIVFAMIVDPAGLDFVESLARPGGNITGFMQFEYSLAGKWLELLKQIAPGVTRAAVLRDPTSRSGIGQFAVIQGVAPQLGIEVVPVNVRDAAEIERRIAAFASFPNGGLVMTGGAGTAHRELIFGLVARHRLPAVYPYRYHVDDGGLVSYGPDLPDLFRQAAAYVDRILKGEKPSDLPVQAPTRYELIINLKAAKAIGLGVPPAVLVRADQVIE
jgi:putative tryptophan/tyrosine transport system substrate-binding protein